VQPLKRGRKSGASLALLSPGAVVGAAQRLPCPAHLSDAARDVWLQVVNDQPADSFTAVHAPLLEQYARHVVQSRQLAQQLEAFDSSWLADDEGLKRWDRLMAMHEREGRAASSLATRLRITRQAIDQTTVARKLINAPKTPKPWELPQEHPDDGDE